MQQRNHDECWCECKELNDCGSCINDYIWNPCTCYCECNKASKIDEHSDIKNCYCERSLFIKLVSTWEDEISNTNETSLDNETAICENNFLNQTISLVIICTLLLAVLSVGCYFYYARYWEIRICSIILI